MRIASLVSENPYLDFARALELFYQPPKPAPGIHPMAAIAPTRRDWAKAPPSGPSRWWVRTCRIGRNATLHPHVVIYEGAEIGDDFLAHSHAVVREFCRVGDRVILQNGVVVGGDGFGFAKRADGTHYKIVQSGITVIEDDVEIQCSPPSTAPRSAKRACKRGAKIDNLVQVGHACVVGEDNIICAQTGLAGSSVLERNVLLAGQVGVSGHLTIHDDAIVYAQSGVGGDVAAGSRISGSPAFDASEWLRAITAFPKLPELLQDRARTEEESGTTRTEWTEQKPPHERSAGPVAYQNDDFLNSSDARPLRILSEYLEPLSHFRREKIRDTVVFFGSARMHGRRAARRAITTMRANWRAC